MRKAVKKAVASLMAGFFAFAAVVGMLPTEASASGISKTGKQIAKKPLNLEEGAEYHAYILFQAKESWVFRNYFYDGTEGIENEELWNKLVTTCKLEKAEAVDGDVEDAVIKGNGHYTVKITNMNGSPSADTAGGEPEFSILGFSTDIPANNTIKFDNVKVKVDGIDQGSRTGDQVYYDKDALVEPGIIAVEVMNTWHDECDSMSMPLPRDSVEISFDVSGFKFDNPDAVEVKADDSKDNANITASDSSKEESEDSAVPLSTTTIAIVAVVVVVIIVVVAVVIVCVRKKKK